MMQRVPARQLTLNLNTVQVRPSTNSPLSIPSNVGTTSTAAHFCTTMPVNARGSPAPATSTAKRILGMLQNLPLTGPAPPSNNANPTPSCNTAQRQQLCPTPALTAYGSPIFHQAAVDGHGILQMCPAPADAKKARLVLDTLQQLAHHVSRDSATSQHKPNSSASYLQQAVPHADQKAPAVCTNILHVNMIGSVPSESASFIHENLHAYQASTQHYSGPAHPSCSMEPRFHAADDDDDAPSAPPMSCLPPEQYTSQLQQAAQQPLDMQVQQVFAASQPPPAVSAPPLGPYTPPLEPVVITPSRLRHMHHGQASTHAQGLHTTMSDIAATPTAVPGSTTAAMEFPTVAAVTGKRERSPAAAVGLGGDSSALAFAGAAGGHQQTPVDLTGQYQCGPDEEVHKPLHRRRTTSGAAYKDDKHQMRQSPGGALNSATSADAQPTDVQTTSDQGQPADDAATGSITNASEHLQHSVSPSAAAGPSSQAVKRQLSDISTELQKASEVTNILASCQKRSRCSLGAACATSGLPGSAADADHQPSPASHHPCTRADTPSRSCKRHADEAQMGGDGMGASDEEAVGVAADGTGVGGGKRQQVSLQQDYTTLAANMGTPASTSGDPPPTATSPARASVLVKRLSSEAQMQSDGHHVEDDILPDEQARLKVARRLMVGTSNAGQQPAAAEVCTSAGGLLPQSTLGTTQHPSAAAPAPAASGSEDIDAVMVGAGTDNMQQDQEPVCSATDEGLDIPDAAATDAGAATMMDADTAAAAPTDTFHAAAAHPCQASPHLDSLSPAGCMMQGDTHMGPTAPWHEQLTALLHEFPSVTGLLSAFQNGGSAAAAGTSYGPALQALMQRPGGCDLLLDFARVASSAALLPGQETAVAGGNSCYPPAASPVLGSPFAQPTASPSPPVMCVQSALNCLQSSVSIWQLSAARQVLGALSVALQAEQESLHLKQHMQRQAALCNDLQVGSWSCEFASAAGRVELYC